MKFTKGFLCFFLLTSGLLFCQKDTICFNSDWKVQELDSVAFYRVFEFREIRFKDFYFFTDYNSDGLKLKTGASLEKESDKFDGEIVYFNDGKYISERVLYRNGAPYGSHRIYYNSGKLKSVKTYNFGLLIGPSKVYYENGVLKESGVYNNNERNGEWKGYYPNRKLKEKGQYIDGNRAGVWKVYYYNGTSQD